ncbi:MAG: flagellar biosynthetic protein FliO [Planctomycetes bacterium]|nr:flagellar biosynthetic protein FliO [Planctomycetota bacterium]
MLNTLAAIQTPSPTAGGPDMTRYVLVCVLLLGLICLAAYLFRRFVASAIKSKAAGRSLQIIDVLPLGGKQRMCVVRCYDRTFALGLGDKEVALIAEIDGALTPVAPPKTPFAAFLKREQATTEDSAAPVTPTKRKLFPVGGLFG